jgi:NTE family protein
VTHVKGAHCRMLTAGRLFVVVLSLLACVPGSASSADSTFVIRPRFRAPFAVEHGLLREKTLQRPKVGLVLSGGGSRGAAQIGVLRALERHGIPIDFIAATSMGSIIGGLYAAGYTVAELESLAVHTKWDEVIVLGDETQRSQLFVDQKLADDRSFIAIRFEGLEPVLPPAVSSGQRLTDFLSARMLQALYYPFPDFDHLKIPFRAVATDLVSGERVVMHDGSLAEAMRASATVPLLFSPIEKNNMRLVDGGLVSNVPVDLARAAGCDLIIVVNSTSGLRTADEMKSPWQTADQIMGIMMKRVNERQMEDADVVITPAIGRHLSSAFTGLDTLIEHGDATAERSMAEILALYSQRSDSLAALAGGPVLSAPITIERADASIPDSLWEQKRLPYTTGPVRLFDLESMLGRLYASGYFDSVWAQVRTNSGGTQLKVFGHPNPTLRSVTFSGNRVLPSADLHMAFAPLLGHVLNHAATTRALEGLTRLYRKRGFSLAHVDSVLFDEQTGALSLTLDEGIISRIDVQGGIRTKDEFVLREFPLQPGEVFQLDKARRGLTQISGTTLFEYVYLEITSLTKEIVLTIRIKERPSQLVRLGLHADDERQLQGMVDIRDENWQGTGMQIGFQLAGGQRNGDASLGFSMKGLFNTYLTFGVSAFHRTWDTYLYGNAPKTHPNRWSREQLGEYRDIRYGFSLTVGGLLERLGNATAEFIWQDIRLVNLQDLAGLDDRHRLAIIRLATLVDTKDAYPFPTKGVGFRMSYEFSLEGLGSQVSYNSLQAMYENYASWGENVTFHPRFTIGFADNTMPLAQQFRLGGRDSFFGLREEDRRGRQLILMNIEVRYRLPVRLLFDTYLRARYDLGTISAVPEEIKFSSLLHGVGIELALKTPVGPAVFGVGKAFYFTADLPDQPVQQGPFMAYVMLGYQL